MNIIFDGNYLFHRNFSIFSTYYKNQPMEDVLEDAEKQQVLLRKCVIDICFTVRKFHDIKCVVFVIDSSSWRYSLYNDYKYALTRVRQPFYPQFLKMLDKLENLLKKKGIIVSRVNGAEGDDLMYMWSIYFGECLNENSVIITGDSDMRQILNKNVSLFDNNSKNLRIYCISEREVFWNDYVDANIQVIPTVPFQILLYKVIMGDKSDNIPKLKNGFGNVAFEKFITWLKEQALFHCPENVDFISMAQWIASQFSKFIHVSDKEILGKVLFNLKMTWLNLSVYNSDDFKTEDARGLLKRMLNDIDVQKNNYSYNKEYTLENFYGMIIK